MKILAISGSSREASTNTALLQTMKNLAPLGVDISVVCHLHTLPVFSPDAEGENTPSVVREFLESVSANDGIVISSPEYIRAIPSGFKKGVRIKTWTGFMPQVRGSPGIRWD